MDPLELLAQRRSIRRFTAQPVDDALVRACVASASHAATSHLVQGYCALRVRDPGKRARMAELAGDQPHVRDAPVLLVICADQRRHELVARRRGVPYVANLETAVVATIDAALFAQSLALCFEARGLGICFIGGLRNDVPALVELLAVPHGTWPLFGLVAGHAAESPRQWPRLEPDALVYDERFPSDDELARQVDAYDAALGAEFAARGKSGRSWSAQVARLHAQGNREGLGAAYRAQGATLD